jgi:hypothetical protein
MPLRTAIAVFASALLFAVAVSLLPAQPGTVPLLYTAAAAMVAGELVYSLARRREAKLELAALAVALAAMSIYAAYSYLVGPASQQLARDLQSIAEARQIWLEYFSRIAASVGAVVSIVQYVLTALAPVTGGATAAIAWAVGEVVDVIDEAMSTVAGYIGYAYSVTAILIPVVKFAELFPAFFVPLSALFVKSKKGMALAAYLALAPLAVAYAVSAVPALQPPTIQPPPKLPFNATTLGAVLVKSNAWVIAEFAGPNGSAFWYSIPPDRLVNVTLPVGTWRLDRIIFDFVPLPADIELTVFNGTVLRAVNYTIGSVTAPGTAMYVDASSDAVQYGEGGYAAVLPNGTIYINVTYRWWEMWSAAATLPPNAHGRWDTPRNATWVFRYACYGTVEECGARTYNVSGLAADFVDLYVKVLSAGNTTVSYDASYTPAAVSPYFWNQICAASTTPIQQFFGAAQCPAWKPAQSWRAAVTVTPTPVYNGTGPNATEVRTWHVATVAVTLLYNPVQVPILAGFAAPGPNGTVVTAAAVGAAYAYGLIDALRMVPGVSAPASLVQLASEAAAPFMWAIQLVGWGIGLVYALIAVTAGAAGLLILLDAGGPLLRLLGLEHFISPRLSLRMGNLDTMPIQLASSGLTKFGASGSAVGSATQSAVNQAVEAATKSWVAYAKMWALYTSSVLKWAAAIYKNPWSAAASAAAAGYVAAKVEGPSILVRPVKVTAPHPSLRPAARALEALLNAGLRGGAAVSIGLYRYAKGLHYIMHPSGMEHAHKAREAARAFWAAAHLRVDYFAAKYLGYVMRRAFELTGDARLSALWSIFTWRPPRHSGDIAAFLYVAGVRRPVMVSSAALAEGFRLFGLKLTPEQAAAMWLSRFGYDYAKIKAYIDAHKLNVDPAYLPSTSMLRRYLAEHGIERLRQGDPTALYLASLKEFRRMAREELGLLVGRDGSVRPIWDMWLKGAGRAAERGDVSAVMRLPPGEMGSKIRYYEPVAAEYSLRELRRAMEAAVRQAAAAGIPREVAEKGVWAAMADPVQRVWLGLDSAYSKVMDALKRAAADIIPKDVAERGAAALTGEQLRALYELVKSDRPQWFELLPEHVQQQVLERLPYGDWDYARSPKYAAAVADISWREITKTGRVVEHRVMDYLPVRDALLAERLAAFESLPAAASPPASPAPPPDWSEAERLARKLGATSYETPQGEAPIRIDAIARTPEEARRMLLEAAEADAAVRRYYDEGVDIPGSYEKLVEALRDVAGGDEEAAARAAKETAAFVLAFSGELSDMAAEEGYPEVAAAISDLSAEIGKSVKVEEAKGEPAAVAGEEAVGEAEEVVGETEEVIKEDEEAVGEDEALGEEREEGKEEGKEGEGEGPSLEEEEERAKEALRRMGIDLDQLGREADRRVEEARRRAEEERDRVLADELARRYGIPRGAADALVGRFGGGAAAVAEDVRRVDEWMREAGFSDEERARLLAERIDDIVDDPNRVIDELARRAAERAPKELRDLVAEDLKRGRFGEVNYKLAQIERYCEARGGCTPEDRRDLYRRL